MEKKDKIIDKTKVNIGVSKLDEKTRKDLFEKFVDSGGKIIDERSRKSNLIIDREKQKQLQQKIDKHGNTRQIKDKQKPAYVLPRSGKRSSTSGVDYSLSGMFGRLKIRIKLKIYGVTGYNGYYFNNKFFRKFNTIYKVALMELQINYLEVFRKNPSVGRTITQKLDGYKPLYVELIEMIGNIFDKIAADQIIEQYINFPEVPKKTSELRELILQLYKKLQVLSPYENSIETAFDRAIELYSKADETKAESPSAMRKRVRNSLFIVFHKLLPRLHLLFCYYQQEFISMLDPEIAVILGIKDAEKPGNRMLTNYSNEAQIVVEDQDQQEETGESTTVDDGRSKALKTGLEIISAIDFEKSRKIYDRNRMFEHITDADKVFIAYMLFCEFDAEYSFILTTNKVKFKMDFADRTKKDFRTQLNILYDKMKQSSDNFKEYSEEVRNYDHMRREKPTGPAQYIEFTKRLESFERNKTNCGKKTLSTIRGYFQEIADELNILIDDMNSHQQYIENPQDVLLFDPLIEGDKKLNGKKIYESVYLIYSYSLAFVSRLMPGGDLSGSLEFNKDEIESQKKIVAEQEVEKANKESETKSQKSVLEELDDLL